MALKQGLLGLLNYGEMTGYELAKAFNDSLSFFWQAQTSQIYRELNQLEAEGLLHSRIEVQTGKPDKRVYAITAQGKAELDRWLASDLDTEMMPSPPERDGICRRFDRTVSGADPVAFGCGGLGYDR